jgi:hypothetical protein
MASSRIRVWRFTNRIDQGVLGDAQEKRILDHIDGASDS